MIFNKAIYKANLKRFWVGALLYLLILLMMSQFWAPFDGYTFSEDSYKIPYQYYFEELFYMSSALAAFVAVIVAVLVYKNLHSKKQAVFRHSMPVSRLGGFASTLLSAFTLMGTPVIVTGLIIAGATGEVKSSAFWVLLTLLSQFAYFSVATISALLTGTTWIIFPIYAFLNYVVPLAGMFYDALMDIFALGYESYYGSVFYGINFSSLLFEIITEAEGTFVWEGGLITAIIILISVVLYALSFLLYKNRKMERCEDASAFKWFSYVLKYIVTLVITLGMFCVFESNFSDTPVMWAAWTFIASFVSYFGMEMILRKKLKVWGAYKGYIIFVIAFAAFLSFMAFTNIFGYETYVPEADKVESACISGEAFTHRESIELLVDKHSEIIESKNGEILHEEGNNYWKYNVDISSDEMVRFYIQYQTDNKRISRSYAIAYSDFMEFMDTLYESEEFKYEYEDFFDVASKDVGTVKLYNNRPDKRNVNISDEEKKAFLDAISTDILNSSYSELHSPSVPELCQIRIGYMPEEYSLQINNEEGEGVYISEQTLYIYVNENYKETIALMHEKGYSDFLVTQTMYDNRDGEIYY